MKPTVIIEFVMVESQEDAMSVSKICLPSSRRVRVVSVVFACLPDGKPDKGGTYAIVERCLGLAAERASND